MGNSAVVLSRNTLSRNRNCHVVDRSYVGTRQGLIEVLAEVNAGVQLHGSWKKDGVRAYIERLR